MFFTDPARLQVPQPWATWGRPFLSGVSQPQKTQVVGKENRARSLMWGEGIREKPQIAGSSFAYQQLILSRIEVIKS